MPAKRPCHPLSYPAVAGVAEVAGIAGVAGVAEALSRASVTALQASNELLAHYSDTGDPSTQRAVDALIDHAADTLRALTDSMADISGGLGHRA